MRARLQWLFTPRVAYKDPLIAQRAQGLLLFIAVAFVLSIVATATQFVQIINNGGLAAGNEAINQVLGVIGPIVLLLGFVFVHLGYYQYVAAALLIISLISMYPIAIGNLQSVDVIIIVMPLLTAGLLLGRRAALITLAITLLLVAQPTLISPSTTTDYGAFLLISLVLGFITFYLSVFGSHIQATARKSLTELNSLREMIGTTLSHATVRDEIELARDTIDLIRDNLGITFARLFIVEGNEIRQRIQTGLNRKQMAVDTDFELNPGSAIFEAIRTKAIVRLNLQSVDVLRSHLLQGTRAALAVPVIFEDNVTAILDIQSEDLDEFNQGDINVIRFIAQQLGTALGQGNRLAALRSELSSQEATIQRQNDKLLNYERRERQATTQAWVNYLRQRGMDYMGFDIESALDEPNPAFSLNDDLQPAIQTGDISLRYEGEQQILSVPIILRGYTLGAMSFRVPEGSQTIGPRQQELIRSVVQRLALALENKRLFEQSQSQAQRESKANEVGSLLLSSTDIDTVLRMAADSFNQAMGAVQTQIRLRPENPELKSGEGVSS